MSDPEILSRFTVVLWRPASPGNVGSVARAMKNMGVGRLRIAEPIAYDDPNFFRAESERMAWGASDLLAAREEYPTLEAAVADAILVAGTTSDPPDGHTVLPPRDLAPRLVETARKGPVVLLFGQERIGLTREAMARCQVLGSIPVSADYASLNLAQAVLIFLYELRLAASSPRPFAAQPGAGIHEAGTEKRGAEELPTQVEMEGFYARLLRALDAIGFFEGTSRAHMVRELRRIFNRALLTRREVRILEGVVHRIDVDRRGR